MVKLYTKKLFLLLFILIVGCKLYAQSGTPLTLDFSNNVDNVTSANNSSGSAITDVGGVGGGSVLNPFGGSFYYATSAYRLGSNAVTYSFPAGQTVTGKLTTVSHNVKFGSASGNNAYIIPMEAGNSNYTDIISAERSPMQKLFIVYTYFKGTASGSTTMKLTMTYTDGTSETTSDIPIYDYRTTSLSSTNNALWAISVVNKDNGAITNSGYNMIETDVASYFTNLSTKTPTQLQIANSGSGSGTSKMYVHAITGFPVSKIQGTVYNDNTADGTINGTGSNAAAGFVSCVDASYKVLKTTTVASDGTYTLLNTPYSGTNYSVILTSNDPGLGNTLSASSLASGWVSGTTPNSSYSGTGTTSIYPITRSSSTTDNSGINFSVHQLPTAYSRTVTLSVANASIAIKAGAQFPMNATNSTNNADVTLTDQLLDLAGTGLYTTAATNMNGTTSNAKIYLPSTIADGGSLVYNGATVSTNTPYPSTSSTYQNNLLYYKFTSNSFYTSNTSFSFNYQILDNLNFLSSNVATYTIKIPFSLPVSYTQELQASILNY